MKFNEMVYWNSNSYGSAITLWRGHIIGVYTILAIVVPVIVPMPLIPILYKVLPTKIIWRYERK